MAYYSKRNVKNLDSEWSKRNCNIRTRLIYARSHHRGQISTSAMTVLSVEQMAALAGRRKEGDTLVDTLKGWPDGAGFSHYKVRSSWYCRSWQRTSQCGWHQAAVMNQSRTLSPVDALHKLDKEGLNTCQAAQQACTLTAVVVQYGATAWANKKLLFNI